MPEPFPIAPSLILHPPIVSSKAISFVKVSVVKIASAALFAAKGVRSNLPATISIPSNIQSIGRGTPITPVEHTSTSSFLIPNCSAVHWAICSVSWCPFIPVTALALPLLITIA